MGGGHGGNFGRTAGMRIGSMEFINSLSEKRYSTEEALDIISNALTALSFIPGIDTFADLAAIPVDIARGDYVGAVLDLLGAVPILGEIADGAKTVDKVADAAKLVDKVSDSAQLANKTTSTIQSISPYKITQTHKLTLSKKKVFRAC